MEAIAITATPLPPLGKFWWLPLAAGVLSMLVGILALCYPGPTLLVIGLLLGIYLLLWGVVSAFRGIAEARACPSLRGSC